MTRLCFHQALQQRALLHLSQRRLGRGEAQDHVALLNLERVHVSLKLLRAALSLPAAGWQESCLEKQRIATMVKSPISDARTARRVNELALPAGHGVTPAPT